MLKNYVGNRPEDVPRPRSWGSSNYSSLERQDDTPPRDEDAVNRVVEKLQPLPLRLSRNGQAVPVTEMPPPSELMDSGYVDSTTHTPEIQQEPSPPNSLLARVKDILVRDKSPTLSPPVSNRSTEHTTENTIRTDSSNGLSFREGEGRPSLQPLLSVSPVFPERDFVTLSPVYSPVDTPPMTMVGVESDDIRIPTYYPRTKNYFKLALCSTILCCFPVGLIALFHSYQVRRCSQERDRLGALNHSRKARKISFTSIVAGISLWTAVAVVLTVILVLN